MATRRSPKASEKKNVKFGVELGKVLRRYFDKPPFIPPEYKFGFVWTPKLFGDVVGVSDSAVRQWLRGVALPSLYMPTIIVKLFGPEPDKFTGQIEALWALLRSCERARDGVEEDEAASQANPTAGGQPNLAQWPNAADTAPIRTTLPEDVQSIRGEVQHVADTQTEHGEMLRFLVAAEMARRGDGLANSGVTDEAVVILAKRISEQVESPEHALAELGAALDELLQLRADAKRGSNLDTDVEAVLRRIDERARAEKFEDADSEAERAFHSWERCEVEERAIGLRFAEENIRTKRLLRDAEGAAFWIEKRVAFIAGTHFAYYDDLKPEIDKYSHSGYVYGINLDLEIARHLIRNSITGEVSIQQRYVLWTQTGIVQLVLGRRQKEKASLEAAVAVFRASVKGRSRSDHPREQKLLGDALMALSERQEGTALLEEAVTAFRSALEVYTRAHSPLKWAMTQDSLGNALVALGERQEGTALLEEAVTAFRSALEVYTCADSPLECAMTQDSLGNALMALGEWQEGSALLDAAMTAYRSALEIYTRSDRPLDWAMTQNSLCNVLVVLGERQEGTALLDAAVAASRSALEIYTRDDLPLDWAMAQNDLGVALRTLGERQEGTALLEEAVTAFRSALEVHTPADLPIRWKMTERNLERALTILKSKQE